MDTFPLGSNSGFFQTEVEFNTRKEVRLPPNVNIIALRETFLSEAPFVCRSNTTFWRKMIDSKEFVGMFTSSFNIVHSSIVPENGCVNVDALNNIKDSPLIKLMSTNLASMFLMIKRKDHDIFFNRLPDLLFFMIINSLQTSMPKHARVYNSVRFREILLDWINELVGGIRLTHPQHNREWIFAGATDAQIMTTNTGMLHSKASESLNRTRCRTGLLGAGQTSYSVEHSPLINAFFAMNNIKRGSANSLQITLSHLPNRPLVFLNDESITKCGKIREKKIEMQVAREITKHGVHRQKELFKDFQKAQQTYVNDMKHLRDALSTNIAVLENKTVSNKRLLAAIAASANPSSSDVLLSAGNSALSPSGPGTDHCGLVHFSGVFVDRFLAECFQSIGQRNTVGQLQSIHKNLRQNFVGYSSRVWPKCSKRHHFERIVHDNSNNWSVRGNCD